MKIVFRGWRVRFVVLVAGSLLILLGLLTLSAPVFSADPGDDSGKDHRVGTGQVHLQFRLDQQDRLRASAPRPSGMTQAQGWTSLLSEDFEGGFPGTAWSLYGDPTWGKRGYRKYAGQSSGYAVGGGAHGVQPPGPYPNNVDSWMVAGPFDLTDATDAQVQFHAWIDTEYRSTDEHDDFAIYASVDGQHFSGTGWWGNWAGPDHCNGWCNDTFDLTDVCGQPKVWIAVRFRSDSNSTNDEGVYVDDIEVRAKFRDNTTHFSIYLPEVWKIESSESETRQVTSAQGAVISTQSGIQLQIHAGTVPHRADGSAGTTTFSIETNAQPPAPLPADVRAVSSIVKFGPDGFVFAEPVGMRLPMPSVDDKSKLNILRYQPGAGKWLRYPMSFNGNSVTMAGYDLGYAVVTMPSLSVEQSSPSISNWDGYNGAFYWGNTNCPVGAAMGNFCWYYFTITKVTLKYPDQQSMLGMIMKTGSDSTGSWPQCYESVGNSSSKVCMFSLPQGQYEFCVTAFEAPMEKSIPEKRTYSKRGIANLNTAAHYEQVWGWTGVVPLMLEDGGVWGTADVVHCPSPSPTIPVGTGELQATLTWVNTASESTDLDLHLYGPDGLHIYWNNEGPQKNLRLDKDWQHAEGSAIENIYSVGTPLPSGHYRLVVKHFRDSDPPKSYTVRFIFRGSSSTWAKRITTGEQVITEFTVR